MFSSFILFFFFVYFACVLNKMSLALQKFAKPRPQGQGLEAEGQGHSFMALRPGLGQGLTSLVVWFFYIDSNIVLGADSWQCCIFSGSLRVISSNPNSLEELYSRRLLRLFTAKECLAFNIEYSPAQFYGSSCCPSSLRHRGLERRWATGQCSNCAS